MQASAPFRLAGLADIAGIVLLRTREDHHPPARRSSKARARSALAGPAQQTKSTNPEGLPSETCLAEIDTDTASKRLRLMRGSERLGWAPRPVGMSGARIVRRML